MELEQINQQELQEQLKVKGIDLQEVPVDLIEGHLKEVGETIEDPEKLVENLVSFIDDVRKDEDRFA